MKEDVRIDWEQFNPRAYVRDNYAYVHDEDRQIIDLLFPYLAKKLKITNRVLDIGTGPNLYPLLAIAPFVASIDCMEYSRRNTNYLKKELQHPHDNWKLFADYLRRKNNCYRQAIPELLTQKIRIQRGNIFSTNKRGYDCASMFFCAESITDNRKDFTHACTQFVKTVKIGGTLLALFMENSSGYVIDSIRFPAYPVNQNSLIQTFTPLVSELKIHRIKRANCPLRAGYTGMLLLIGKKAK